MTLVPHSNRVTNLSLKSSHRTLPSSLTIHNQPVISHSTQNTACVLLFAEGSLGFIPMIVIWLSARFLLSF